MNPKRFRQLHEIKHPPEEIASRSARVYRALLERSTHVRSGNFDSLAVADLAHLFQLYDAEFFGGLLEATLREHGTGPVEFRLSNRLTSAAGKTFMRKTRKRSGFRVVEGTKYEIAISTFLLFQSFEQVDRSVTVAGLVCLDRLEALQRIFEHELLHLAEFLTEGHSRCSAEPFHRLSRDIFGHSGVKHDLVTRGEIAARAHALVPGDRVAFDHDGLRREGRVNRITKRATILVEDQGGQLFSDGKRYLRFYVPLDRLRKEA